MLALSGWGSPLAVAHLAFAVGIVPLIFAAMMHFVPVLTRTGDTDPRLVGLPMIAQATGLVAVAGMQGWLAYDFVYAAATLDLILAGVLLNWIALRARASLGSPHPGWRWYGVALGCLVLALSAILLIPVWPSYWRALRLFHMHLNILGLVGLAALGTLPVLLPTALGKPDPEAAGWLRRRLWLVASGALVIATGAIIAWPFAAPGTALLLVAALGLAGQWIRRFGAWSLLRDGVAASLLAALMGLMITLVAGLLHGAGVLPTRPSLLAWGAGFLLPLVTGALSQLLPVWRWPGPTIPARNLMRQKLAASGTWRGLLFLASALALLSGHERLGGAFVACGLALFIIALLQAVRTHRSTR
ncbi:MAG: hypothetical protein H6R13_1369 [Proteobacteria bacterium]|nr:hypothetical protein [Pseudomonadota bacterium]